MNWIYSINWYLGLNNLIWREIRSRLKAKSKISLDENFGFYSNLMKNRFQYLFTIEIVFYDILTPKAFFPPLIDFLLFYILLFLSIWNHCYFELLSWIIKSISLDHNHFSFSQSINHIYIYISWFCSFF